MRYALLILAAALSGCAWETYQNAEGKTALRPKYEAGTRVYYQDGSYSRNMNYNQYRPEQHAVKPEREVEHDVRGTTWEKPAQ
ncbi:spore cortex protein [Bergeriella denitrificans]|uniref:Lipoprotein n=1 Tax=Bergeriella denitrificans TaxID=494 RepID=A0A378UIG9_BERDE|nr:spore cortex protein [Bergeriella denitrificans]STZ77136.1 lipoprotein [Bergeriella denitrificans]